MAKSQATQSVNPATQSRSSFAQSYHGLVFLLMLPYFRAYDHYVRQPLEQIVVESDPPKAIGMIRRWLTLRKAEIAYIQVAGAVLFTAVVSCFSWDGIDNRHWTCAGFWYASIILSIASVLLGAQQYLVLFNVEAEDWQSLQGRFRRNTSKGWKPKHSVLFVMQCPMMAFSYSVITFGGGLTSYVVSPFAKEGIWNDNAKVMIMYLTFVLGIATIFTICSAHVHRIQDK